MRSFASAISDRLQPYIMPMASLGVRGLGVLAGFAVTVVIGRLFGPVANGQYALVSQTALFLATIAIGGLDLAVAREFPQARVLGKSVSRRSLGLVLGQALGIALILACLVAAASGQFMHMLGRPDLPEGSIMLLCLILLSRTLLRMLATILRAQSYFLTSQAVEMLFVPLLTIVIIAVGMAGTVSEILLATLLAGCIAVAGALVVAWRESSGASDAWQVDMRRLYATAWPLWGVAISQNFADWFSLVTITAIGGLAETGLFRVASQFAVSFSIITLGLLGTYTTLFSAAFHASDKVRAAKVVGQATALSIVLVLPLTLATMVLAPWLLGMVGPEFTSHANVLRVLLLGQVAFAIAGSASMALAMSGHPRVNLWVNLGTTAAIVLTAPFFVRNWGAIGLAACISSLMLLKAVACVIAVRRLEDIDVLTGRLVDGKST